jgi:hypothetical protein
MMPQVAWDFLALGGAVISCLATLARRHMLSDTLGRWHSAPGSVQAALAFQSIVTGGIAVSLAIGGHHANEVETLLLMVSAVVSVALWRNLSRQERETEVSQ